MLEQLELIFSAMILLTTFLLLIAKRMPHKVYIFAWQSLFLAAAACSEAINQHALELFLSALLIVGIKVIFIPWFLLKLNKQLPTKINYLPTALVAKPFLLSTLAILIVIFAYHLVLPLQKFALLHNSNILAMALAVVLLGMLLMITHRKAISHALGFMIMENGIFFAALVATTGMPMIVELGVAFDVLIAMILFGVSFFHINSSIDSLDVDRLNKLRET